MQSDVIFTPSLNAAKTLLVSFHQLQLGTKIISSRKLQWVLLLGAYSLLKRSFIYFLHRMK